MTVVAVVFGKLCSQQVKKERFVELKRIQCANDTVDVLIFDLVNVSY
jgi:hypothetical protein